MLLLSIWLEQERAVATLRIALGVLLLLNGIHLGLLVANLRPVLARIYTRKQLWAIGLIALGGGTVVPLCLVCVGDSPSLMLSSAIFILLGSLAIRLAIIRIPHTPP